MASASSALTIRGQRQNGLVVQQATRLTSALRLVRSAFRAATGRAPFMQSPFVVLDVPRAQRVVAAATDADASRNILFYNGDHWQLGDGWIGPAPLPGDEGYGDFIALINRIFTSSNKVKEVVDRHRDGVVGRTPAIGFRPKRQLKEGEKATDDEQAAIDELEAAVRNWWEESKAGEILKQAITNMLLTDRGPLRLFIPSGMIVSDAANPRVGTIPTPETLEDALDYLWPDAPEASQATVYTDPNSRQQAGVFTYTRATTPLMAPNEQYGQFAEASYLSPETDARGDPKTVVTILSMGAGAARAQMTVSLQGRLTMFEMVRPRLISEQVRSHQKSLNLAETMIPRNVETSGFRETTLLNATMPGHYDTDEKTGRKTWVADPYPTGPALRHFVTGLSYEDESTGKTVVTNPSVHETEPVSPDAAIKASDHSYQRILDEVDQSHILVSTSSGRAHQQLRTGFENSMNPTAEQVRAGARWMLDTLVAFAEALMNDVGRWSDLVEAYVEVVIDAGPLAADEQRANDESYTRGTLSRQTAMQRNNVLDVRGELARIAQQPGANIDVLQKQAAGIEALVRAGASLEDAAATVGLTTDQVKALIAHPPPPPVNPSSAPTDAPPSGGAGASKPPNARNATAGQAKQQQARAASSKNPPVSGESQQGKQATR